MVSEYEDTDGGLLVGLRAELHRAAGSLLLAARAGSAQQRHELEFDQRRCALHQLRLVLSPFPTIRYQPRGDDGARSAAPR